jgi:hypothetical protein
MIIYFVQSSWLGINYLFVLTDIVYDDFIRVSIFQSYFIFLFILSVHLATLHPFKKGVDEVKLLSVQ